MFDLDLYNLKRLLEQNQSQVLSLYLRVDADLRENQALTPAWYSWTMNALAAVEGALSGADKGVWPAVRQRVVAFLDGHIVKERGLVLFAGPDFTLHYALPVMPHDHLVRFGGPLVAPLIWLMDEFERYLIVLVEREEAHFLTTYLGHIGREQAMTSERFSFDAQDSTLRSGATPRAARKSVVDQDIVSRFQRDVAQTTVELMRNFGAARAIIGGNTKSAERIRDLLSAEVVVAGVLPIPFEESDAEVLARVLPVSLKFEREKERELVEQVIERAFGGGPAVVGVSAVREALSQDRVATLVASWPPRDHELLHHLTLDALKQSCRIELVYGEAAERLNTVGDVAALLR